MSICSDRMTHRRVWSAIRTLPFLLVLVASVAVTDLAAQRPESTTLPPPAGLTGAVEDSLWQVWEHDQPFWRECGDFPSAHGNPNEQCAIPVGEILPYLHPRQFAWMQFAGLSDEYLSPKHACAMASLPTVFGDPYLTTMTMNDDKVVIHYEQSNRYREIWMDGRKHAPPTQLYYMGHSIGWWEGEALVVDTTNFTFDPDGLDDHVHLASSHLKHIVERYERTGPDSMLLTVTIEDPLFLTQPVTYTHKYKKAERDSLRFWNCNLENAQAEMQIMVPDKYDDQ